MNRKLTPILVAWVLAMSAATAPAQSSNWFPQSVASGDPRPDAVMLWTRAIDPQAATEDLPVALEVSRDPGFQTLTVHRTNLIARAAHDYCLKVRVDGLEPYSTYYYRFTCHETNQSRIGRTKTAPAPQAAQPVRFAVLNCQDYLGRYYNTLWDLVRRETDSLDFIVHLGDSIYETTGDPLFQATGTSRSIQFADSAGAIPLGTPDSPYDAASSLDNYRQLHRTYRSDPAIQRVHELFPVIAIWDDHEFSDDSHGDFGTYFDGSKNEQDPERKRRAEQAFFEYVPIEIGFDEHGIRLSSSDLFPNTRIYRDLRFGQFLHLLLTDYRSFRPDHLIPEDAFPGAVPLDEPTLASLLGSAWTSLMGSFDPYADLDAPTAATLKAGLTTLVTGAYLQAGLTATDAAARAASVVQGRFSARYANGLLAAAGQPPAFDPTQLAALPRGLSFLLLGKQDLFSSFGSRYAVARDPFQIYAAWRSLQNPASQDALGPAQTAWLSSTLAGSPATWKVMGSSVSFCPITFDLANPPLPLPAGFPDELRGRIQLNADHWDGFPQGRQAVLDLLAQHRATVISGDIHASFISRHSASTGGWVPEFTATSVSSESFRETIAEIVMDNPATGGLPGIDQLVGATDLLIDDALQRLPGSDLVGLSTTSHGYVILQANAEALRTTYRHLPAGNVHQDLSAPVLAETLRSLVDETQYRVTVAPGTGGLQLNAESAVPEPFRLQVLHASDLEGGVDAIGDAPNFAAIVDRFMSLETHSIVLSAGDNYIPGPFFNAAGDPSLRATLDAVNEAYFATPGLDIRETSGRADITLMNIIGFDASALGNHEFDAGTAVIREILGTTFSGSGLGGVRWLGTQFPYLSANLDFSADPSLAAVVATVPLPSEAFRSTPADLSAAAAAPKLARSTMITRGGEVIGVVGATTPLLAGISSPGLTQVQNPGAGSNSMTNLASILQPAIDDLLARGIDKIILVSHLQQIALEQELLPLLHGVDISIAGGSDTLLANPDNPLRAGDSAAGPYPWVTRNADGDPALVVSTDGQYKYVGRLVVEFDGDGRILTNSIQSPVSGPYKTDDAGVQAVWGNLADPFAPGTRGALARQLTDGVRGIVTAKDGNILGRSQVFLEGRRLAVRTEECNLGSLTADANLWVAKTYDPATVVSIKNGGGIRAEVGVVDGFTGDLLPTAANRFSGKQAGEISQLDLENSLRFNNQLSLLTLTAAGLKTILEHGVAATRPGATPGQFPQVGGLRFIYDPLRPAVRLAPDGSIVTPGERIRHLVVTGLNRETYDVVVRDGAIVGDALRMFRVVTLNFMANPQASSPGLGGDGYPFPALGRDRVDLATVLSGVPGLATFATPGSEQDALAEFLLATTFRVPFATTDTAAPFDLRIANTENAAPRFLATQASAGGIQLVVPTAAGRSYSIEYAPSTAGPWSALSGGSIVGDGTTHLITDPAKADSLRFYRLVE